MYSAVAPAVTLAPPSHRIEQDERAVVERIAEEPPRPRGRELEDVVEVARDAPEASGVCGWGGLNRAKKTICMKIK